MRRSRRPRPLPRKLWVFAVIAVVSMALAATEYARLPERAGIGRYTVHVQLRDGGGLYRNADVSYRGVTIGKVTALDTTASGARATLSLKSSTQVPADLDAAVRSMSAVGEQYVDLVPRHDGAPYLADGAEIAADRTSTPADIGVILDRIEASLDAIGPGNLRTVLDETFTAVNGVGPQLRELVDALHQLARAAAQVGRPAATLIDQLGPLLDTQTVTGDAIRQWASSLAALTGQLRDSDGHLRGVIGQAAPAAGEISALFAQLRPTLPLLLSNLVTVEQVAAVYNPSLEQILVLYPPLIDATQSAGLPNADDPGQNTFFANQLNDPPPCIEGFLPPDQRRSPTETDTAETPENLYCKVAPDDPRAVRGARNLPCMEFPGRRAATVQLCRDPSGESSDDNAANADEPPRGTPPPPHPIAGTATYIPSDGTYVGPDGNLYADAGLRHSSSVGPVPLRTLLAPPP
ncbi:phospholipid/cholesterol/gamma-HCH transport system substrate-binding protein [Nocardia transvalensis]|uniref:Phospholipid/cholesterol/gamma-HCH transport system substrate-binding protein n=1 Tax=Nocardia transvalensis TaxID=37333 RepID=A0A7W9PLG8_9NOCA|nr:MlaD family protein [Nocardia transvalensis]MBB5917819.1 phospholipid/cholesterol/gamma-HCH transport system substrate-binding protein [Nocardia transvalensis]